MNWMNTDKNIIELLQKDQCLSMCICGKKIN